ncbi:MAG: hypothetical protein WA208_05035 [Thermoanaerobaculia bacterium]
MTRDDLDPDLPEEELEEEEEPKTPYRSLGDDTPIDPDEFPVDEDDDPARRRDPLRKH